MKQGNIIVFYWILLKWLISLKQKKLALYCRSRTMGQWLVCKFQRFYEEMALGFSVYSVKGFWCPFLRLLCQVTCKKTEMKKCVIRITAIDAWKGSKNTSFYQNIKVSRFKTLFRPFTTIRTLFFRHSNAWNHPFRIFLQLFEWMASSCSKIFLYRLNSCPHLFEIFLVPFNCLQHPFVILPWLKILWRSC